MRKFLLLITLFSVLNQILTLQYTFQNGAKVIPNSDNAVLVNTWKDGNIRNNSRSLLHLIRILRTKLNPEKEVESNLIKPLEDFERGIHNRLQRLDLYQMVSINKSKRSAVLAFFGGLLMGAGGWIYEKLSGSSTTELYNILDDENAKIENLMNHQVVLDRELDVLGEGLNKLSEDLAQLQFLELWWSKTLVLYDRISEESNRLFRQYDIVFETIEKGMEGKINLNFYEPGTIQHSLFNLEDLMAKQNKQPIFHGALAMLSYEVAILFLEDGFTLFTMVPIQQADSEMKLYEFESKPFVVNDQLVHFQPENTLLLVDNEDNFIETSSEELAEKCKKIHATYVCHDYNVKKTDPQTSCLMALYKDKQESYVKNCERVILKEPNIIINIQPGLVQIFNPTADKIIYTCPGSSKETRREINEDGTVEIPEGCQAKIGSKIIESMHKDINATTTGFEPLKFKPENYEGEIEYLKEEVAKNDNDTIHIQKSTKFKKETSHIMLWSHHNITQYALLGVCMITIAGLCIYIYKMKKSFKEKTSKQEAPRTEKLSPDEMHITINNLK